MTELQEQYRLLEVSADVSFATLKQAYKDLVLVWHPDRFSDHPRLQKKAEEKLKCINLAYQEISAVHRGDKNSQDADCDCKRDPPCQSRKSETRTHSRSQQTRSSQDPFNCRQHRADPHKRNAQRQSSKTYHSSHPSGIALEQARFVIHHFRFHAIQRPTGTCHHFKSGPFKLDINPTENWLSLENLCDSINGFHPILLAIPCKASRLFMGAEAQELIALFHQIQQL